MHIGHPERSPASEAVVPSATALRFIAAVVAAHALDFYSRGMARRRETDRIHGTIPLGSVISGAPVYPRAMAKGKVDFFNDTGGYGFISTEDADDDVFFHMEDVGGEDLEEGQEIEFDIEQAPKGPRATNVTRL